MGSLWKAKQHYKTALGHAVYGRDLQGQGRACGNIGNFCMLVKEPVKAVHYYTETLHLSAERLQGATIMNEHDMMLQSKGRNLKNLFQLRFQILYTKHYPLS